MSHSAFYLGPETQKEKSPEVPHHLELCTRSHFLSLSPPLFGLGMIHGVIPYSVYIEKSQDLHN